MATAESVGSAPTALKVLSLNVWGLAYISKARQFRLRHIADRIAQGDWDVVALQEIWVESQDWRMLQSKCAQRLPYNKFFYSGAFGSGLAILSRFPIVATHTHPYSLNGQPIDVGHGDWFVGKAAGCVTLDLGASLLVDVYDTHTVAAGGETGPESSRAHRITQSWELCKLVQNSAERGRHVIALGDFNSTPPSLAISLLRHFVQLSDAFLSTHPTLPPHSTSLPDQDSQNGISSDPRRCVAELGVTCDSPLNTWTAGKKLDARARAGQGKRLDYAFYRGPCNPDSPHGSGGSGRLKAKDCRVVFTEQIPGSQLSYTDHFGLEAEFEILPKSSQPTSARASKALAARNASTSLETAIAALYGYLPVSRATQRLHILVFAACVTLALALAVTTPFVGYSGYSFWAAVAIVLATAAGWGGTTMLYSAVVWSEWEQRAVRTVIESMELELTSLSAAASNSTPSSPSRYVSDGGPAQTSVVPQGNLI